jgi:hypothetical protein
VNLEIRPDGQDVQGGVVVFVNTELEAALMFWQAGFGAMIIWD